jgi:hypothetical protein
MNSRCVTILRGEGGAGENFNNGPVLDSKSAIYFFTPRIASFILRLFSALEVV